MADINARILYPVPSFDGGLHNKSSSHVIADNESGDTLNCDLDALGSVATRNGSRLYNSATTLSTGTWYGLTSFTPPSGNSKLVGWRNSSMYYLSGTTWVTIPSADGVFTANTHVAYDIYDGYLFMGQGGQPYKYNGNEFTRHGIEVPSAALVTTAVTAGVVTGTVMYKIANVNSMGVAGDVGSAVTITVAGAIVSMTGLPLAPTSHGINQRWVYRTLAGGTAYFFLTAIADNTTTTFKDNAADASLITPVSTDQGKPPQYRLLKAHKDRLFMVDNTNLSTIYYSEIANPYVVKVTDFEYMGKGDGSIRSLGTISDALLVAKNNSETWLLYLADNNPVNWFQILTNSPYGTDSMFNLTIDNKCMLLACIKDKPMGFYVMDGVNPVNEQIGTDIGNTISNLISDRIQPDIYLLNRGSVNDISGIHWKNKAVISVPYNSSTGNNRIYVYHYNRHPLPKDIGAWMPWTGLNISYLAQHDGKLIGVNSGSSVVGNVYELDVDSLYSDSGVAINSYYETKFFGGRKQDDGNQKDFRWLNLWCTLLGNWNMNIYRKTDFDNSIGDISTINLAAPSSIWGVAVGGMLWDTNAWTNDRTEKEFVIDMGKSNGRRIKFRFTNQNTAGQAFKVNRATFEYILRTRRRYSG